MITNPQRLYWHLLVDTAFQINFMEKYLERSEKIERGLNIFSALAASSSIGAWAVWQQYPWVWGLVICLSQVYAAAKPFLLFSRQVKALGAALPEYRNHLVNLEDGFYYVQNGLWSNEQIHKKTIEMRNRINTTYQTRLNTARLYNREKLIEKAAEENVQYMSRFGEVHHVEEV